MNKFNLEYFVDKNKVSQSDFKSEFLTLDIIEKDGSIKVIANPKKSLTLSSFVYEYPFQMDKKSLYFLNGYQSWTQTREFYHNEKIKNASKIFKPLRNAFAFDKYGDSHIVQNKNYPLHGFTYGYVKGKNSIFIGSLNEDIAYLILQFVVKSNKILLISDVENLTIDKPTTILEVMLDTDIEKGQQEYFSQYTCDAKPLRGYTSWYNYYQNIDDKKIYQSLEDISSSDFELFQIDDGYETKVGDWLSIDEFKFPDGLDNIVSQIHLKNLKAGIWLAPFVCETESDIYKNHKDFIAKDRNGNFIKAGGNWSGFYALDVTKQDVKDYIEKCLRYYCDLGFDFFKLDFLYAPSLIQSRDKSRAQNQVEAMNFIREILKNKLILGCGVPLSSAFNRVDYCRIGPDVSLKFDDVFYMRLFHRERISTKYTILNTLYRYPMSKHCFLNDPDVYLLRDYNNDLSNDQKLSLTTVNILFGDLIMTSDDYSKFSEQQKEFIESLYEFKKSICKKDVVRQKGKILITLSMLDKSEIKLEYKIKTGKMIKL